MNCIAIDNKTALNKVKGGFPYTWDLNIYRGCGHGCKYCYAIYSHGYLDDNNFFDRVYYKKNILECLEKELSSKSWKREVVNIGGVTDSYQPIEKEMQLMPEVLKLFIKYKTPIIISTKSVLILRDIELIDELAKVAGANIAFTITTIDENLRQKLEPFGSPSIERFKAIRKLKTTKATVGVHMMPIIPYLTDNWYNLDKILAYSKRVGADYVLPGMIYLRGKTKPYFLNFLRAYDLNKYNKYSELYKSNSYKEYRKKFYIQLNQIRKRYDISFDYMNGIKEIKSKQLTLLD